MSQQPSTEFLLQDERHHWEKLLPDLVAETGLDSAFHAKIERLAIASSYALQQLCRDPGLLSTLQSLQEFNLEQQYLNDSCAQAQDVTQIKRILRQFRHHKLTEIIYLDVIEKSPLHLTLRYLSDLADQLIRQALAESERNLIAKHGQPLDADGNPISLNIIAMGKLGGRELNFSSDIDLICCYPNEGELSGIGHLTHQEFFSRVVRLFSQLLNEVSEDGFVYRVDLRLRPWGDSGPVALSHSALEHYYQLHGREWEQYAMVKARFITGGETDQRALSAILKPFVYRKYHDYRVFEGLASLKDKIDLQAREKGTQENIKIGRGGIREVEFFVQAFQILKGGRNIKLQTTQIIHCFGILHEQEIVPRQTIDELNTAYLFLRDLENKIQMLNDEQSHTCPKQPILQQRIAFTMGFTDWSQVLEQLALHRTRVSHHFTELFKREDEPEDELVIGDSIGNEQMEAQQIAFMESIGLDDATGISQKLSTFFASKAWSFASSRAKQRFTLLVPRLLKALVACDGQLELFDRLVDLFSSIAGRSVYFELLHQNHVLLNKLVYLFGKSEWIAKEVARYPILLEHLIQTGDTANKFERSTVQKSLQLQLDNVKDDTELELDVLRLFKREQTIVIAIAELSEEITTTEVCRYLSELAEILLHSVYLLARRALQYQYGEPRYTINGEEKTADLAIIGYGKLGGREMHYQSDVDVIFLHNSCGENQVTSGKKSIDNGLYFARLAQKIISMTSIFTGAGKLYEIDSRLRPEGASGLLVSSIQAYLQYQLDKAWTWEHQALVRARHIAGCLELETEFIRIRKHILTLRRDTKELQQEVVAMRNKIYQSKIPPEGEIVNLKHSRGCLVDIEFMVQYWALLYANKVDSICLYSDNIGLLNELLELQLISCEHSQLVDTYQTYHHWLHETVLQNNPAEIPSKTIAAELEQVKKCWNACFG